MFTSHRLSWSTSTLRHMRPGLGCLIALCVGCQAQGPLELPDARSPQVVMRGYSAPAVSVDSGADLVALPRLAGQGSGIWARLGQNAGLWRKAGGNPRIDEQLGWLVDNRGFVTRASGRASPYLHFIVRSLEQQGLPAELALLPMIESAYNPTAVSTRNAVGLWQFMPATATDVGLRRSAGYDARRDVLASTAAAMGYLKRLHTLFDGDWLLALAAYNAGEGTVGRAMEANRRQGLPTDYWHLRLPRETAEYVPRLLALSILVSAPEAHGVRLTPVSDEPYFVKVALPHAVDFKQLAQASGVSEKALRQLNPAYLQGTTQEGPGHLLVPVSMQQPLMASLSTLPQGLAAPSYLPNAPAIAVTQVQP